jgi:phosphoserine phosphatase RsbU/P
LENILVVGSQDNKLTGFLKKMGYEIIEFDGKRPFPEVLDRHLLDLILFDTRLDLGTQDMITFLRTQESTRQVPIVCIADRPRTKQNIKEMGLDRIELFDINYQIGKVVSSIATQLRMTKMAGRDERTANLMEVNAALRDLTEHFKKEMKEAKAIQEGLLPKKLPIADNYEISVCYEPLEEVGGDWYFIEPDAEGRLAMQIADVTGHGISAAFVGSMTKLALTAVGSGMPAELLTKMNTLMAPQLPPGRFVTMGSYLFDPKTLEVHYARAGHPTALLVRGKTREAIEVRGEGFPVGFFDDAEYTGGTAQLEVGDVFIAITDGISEVQNKALETYGMIRMGEVVQKMNPDSSAEQIRDAIRADVDVFRDNRILKDDITMIVLRCR